MEVTTSPIFPSYCAQHSQTARWMKGIYNSLPSVTGTTTRERFRDSSVLSGPTSALTQTSLDRPEKASSSGPQPNELRQRIYKELQKIPQFKFTYPDAPNLKKTLGRTKGTNTCTNVSDYLVVAEVSVNVLMVYLQGIMEDGNSWMKEAGICWWERRRQSAYRHPPSPSCSHVTAARRAQIRSRPFRLTVLRVPHTWTRRNQLFCFPALGGRFSGSLVSISSSHACTF